MCSSRGCGGRGHANDASAVSRRSWCRNGTRRDRRPSSAHPPVPLAQPGGTRARRHAAGMGHGRWPGNGRRGIGTVADSVAAGRGRLQDPAGASPAGRRNRGPGQRCGDATPRCRRRASIRLGCSRRRHGRRRLAAVDAGRRSETVVAFDEAAPALVSRTVARTHRGDRPAGVDTRARRRGGAGDEPLGGCISGGTGVGARADGASAGRRQRRRGST